MLDSQVETLVPQLAASRTAKYTLSASGGKFGGGLLAEVVPVSRRLLSLALHAAAGIVLAVVGLELLPRRRHLPSNAEAHQSRDGRLAAVVFIGRFPLFAVLSAYLG